MILSSRLQIRLRLFLFYLRFWFVYRKLNINVSVGVKPGASRNEVPHDHVLLESIEVVHLTKGCSLGEDPGGILEGSSGDEGLCLERSLGDSK